MTQGEPIPQSRYDVGVRVWLLLFLAPLLALGQSPDEQFEKQVRPLLATKCYGCHNSKMPSPMAGLRLDQPSGLQSVVKPRDADGSRLIQAVRYQSVGMPPTGKLKPEEIASLVEWVTRGAVVPTGPAVLSDGRGDDPRKKHWAWQPLQPGKGTLDEQIRAKLSAHGLQLSPPATKQAQIRRLSFDLTGLPPAPGDSSLPYAQLVEKYLASPHFGERWARHWMDVARYADTGFLSKAMLASFGYRDWLIDAFNRDLPYDRFVALQLAADLMPDASKKDHAALGFLSLGLNPNRAVDLPDVVDDKIDVVTRGLLGITVSCARCHDHKFDPIPTKDYYGLYGVFANTRYGQEPVQLAPMPAFYEKRVAERKRIREAYIQERLEILRNEFREPKEVSRYLDALWAGRKLSRAALENLAREKNLNSLVLNRWADRLLDPARQDALATQFREAVSNPAEAYTAKLTNPTDPNWKGLLFGKEAPPEVPVEEFAFIMTEGDANTTRDLQWQYEQMLNDGLYRGQAQIVLAAQDQPVIKPAHVFRRGNQNDLGEPVGRCFPSVLQPKAPCFHQGSGRLELAQAITAAENPIAARVMVNRVWQKFFGEGLVRTPSDFGVRGDAPTHPELLDRLAADFQQQGWSLKGLIRKIVLSDTYRQASQDNPTARAKDPENKLLWRMPRRRLDFEALRDAMLTVSGKLRPETGGQPISLTALPSDGRRTMYALIEREKPLALLKTFDVADPEQHSPQRYQTTVPQQGLFLLNSPFVGEMARGVAERSPSLEALYARVLQRPPTPEEVQLALPLWQAEKQDSATANPRQAPSAWQYGTGTIDPVAGTIKDFVPFRFFTGRAWQNASAGVDATTGVARLTAGGGAPGDNERSAVVRRWKAPAKGTVEIEGKLVLQVGAFAIRFRLSNGIRGWVISDRKGPLGRWQIDLPSQPADGIQYASNPSVETKITKLSVEEGECIDFVVDSRGDYEADDFSWAPLLRWQGNGGERRFDAREQFAGPPTPRLQPKERLAQVLLLSNEFAFLD